MKANRISKWTQAVTATAFVAAGMASVSALAADLKAADAARAQTRAAIAATPVEKLADNPQLLRAAIEGGSAAFKQNCVQCHGAGAAGSDPSAFDDGVFAVGLSRGGAAGTTVSSP